MTSTPDSAPPSLQGADGEAASNPGQKSAQQNPHDVGTMGTEPANGKSEKAKPIIEPTMTAPIENRPPPPFGSEYGQMESNQSGFDTKAKVGGDGRLNIHINQRSRRLSELLEPVLKHQYQAPQRQPSAGKLSPEASQLFSSGIKGQAPPPLNIVIHVVGSRGDVQPFISLGKVLKETHGHRVRLATHLTFKDFVEENGLEYFNIGGDPAELMAFMVKNPGLMPGMDSIKSGDVGKRRRGIYEILQGCWRSCFEIGNGMGEAVADDKTESRSSIDSGISLDVDNTARPFVADAIIANPPSFAHVHCAEKLGIPLHLMFTMPWSPTQAFPHPLANIQSSNADPNLTNFVSYALVEMMTWQGLGDMINRFREKSLGLEPVSLMWAPGMASRLRIPYTYCWSPALIPKPRDWGSEIYVSGFYFLSLASSFSPDPSLQSFLDSGPPPVYIGFGSIVVDDPDSMTELIFDAIKKTGQRALVSKGWGGFGAEGADLPENVLMLGNVPHDWLFQHVSCVVHHGGAGTTAAGISLGKPTVVVPFFGDQPFWGSMIAKAGAGPKPIPSKSLNADNLAAAILQALEPSTIAKAHKLGEMVRSERGSDAGAESFHRQLNMARLRCSFSPNRVAVWRLRHTQVRLSAFAANVLVNEGLLDFADLKLYRLREYDSEDGPWDPISGGTSALLGTLGSLAMGFADFPVEIIRALKGRPSDTAAKTDDPSSPVQTEMASSLDHAKFFSETDRIPTDPLSPTVESESLSQQSSRECHHPGRSMARALRGTYSRSRSRSRTSSPTRQPSTSGSSNHHHRSNSGQVTLDAAAGAGRSIRRIVGAGLKSPMDFSLSIARGFHNAPKLYGDESVRTADKVTDMQSGLKAAGKEFGYGIYDGVTGLVSQPVDGAKKEGVAGFVKGFGKGIGGIILKPSAAFWALPGYTFKGIYQEVQKHFGSSVQNYILAARTAQGLDDMSHSTVEERLDVVNRWRSAQEGIEKEKQAHSHGKGLSSKDAGWRRKFHPAEKTLADGRHQSIPKEWKADDHAASDNQGPYLSPLASTQASEPSLSDGMQFNKIIDQSVSATSSGNLEEDNTVKRYVYAGIQELISGPVKIDDPTVIKTLIDASVAGARSALSSTPRVSHPAIEKIEPSEHMTKDNGQIPAGVDRAHLHLGSDIVQNEEELVHHENIQKAIDLSLREHSSDGIDPEELDRALALSKRVHEDHLQKVDQAEQEEQIVLRYIQAQAAVETNEDELPQDRGP